MMFVIIAVFIIFVIKLFALTALEIIVNFPLIYIAAIRSYIDIVKKNKTKAYLISLGIITFSFFILLAMFRIPYNIIIWWPTLFLILLYLIAQIIIYILRKK